VGVLHFQPLATLYSVIYAYANVIAAEFGQSHLSCDFFICLIFRGVTIIRCVSCRKACRRGGSK